MYTLYTLLVYKFKPHPVLVAKLQGVVLSELTERLNTLVSALVRIKKCESVGNPLLALEDLVRLLGKIKRYTGDTRFIFDGMPASVSCECAYPEFYTVGEMGRAIPLSYEGERGRGGWGGREGEGEKCMLAMSLS